MNRTFQTRLFASILILLLPIQLALTFYLYHSLKHRWEIELQEHLGAQAGLLKESAQALLKTNRLADLRTFADFYGIKTAARVTLIDLQGKVLADSRVKRDELEALENHLMRPEVRQAMREGIGYSIRYSKSIGQDSMYVALALAERPNESGGILRLSYPIVEHRDQLQRLKTILGGFLLLNSSFLIILAYVAMRPYSKGIVEIQRAAEAMAGGDLSVRTHADESFEYADISRSLNYLAESLDERIRELTRERSLLAAVLTGMEEPAICVSEEGKILFLNPSAKNVLGGPGLEVAGKSFFEVIRHASLGDLIRRGLTERKVFHEELQLYLPDPRIFSVSVFPFDTRAGVRGVMAVLSEITRLRQLEKLRQEFVANVSHELRTPVTVIRGAVETLLGGALNDPKVSREFVESVEEQAERLGRLIDDLLQLSVLDAKAVTLSPSRVDLAALISGIARSFEPLLQKRSIALDLSGLPKNFHVMGDAGRLEQIFVNLIDNACKFNRPQGRVTIRARTDAGRARIEVTDTGAGIPEADLPRIFERFYRVDKARSREMGGTGLGLALVKHLVDRHGGEISVQSRESEGTTFTLLLPLA